MTAPEDDEANAFHKRLVDRTRELEKNEGFEWGRATAQAWLDERVRQWPAGWGNDLHVLIFGDFDPPASAVVYPSLQITVHPEKQKDPVASGGMTALRATVKVEQKTVAAVVEAAARINLLLGVFTVFRWGAGCGWWSWMTHDMPGGVSPPTFDEAMNKSAMAVLSLNMGVRRKVESALFWVREPRALFRESYRSDALRIFAGYWNAFECLVDAVCIAQPRVSLSSAEKQAKVEEFFRDRGGQVTTQNIEECYRQIINVGLRRNAKHAFEVCFGAEAAQKYDNECFGLPDRQSLYAIRNAINHGDIDAENPEELIRIDARLRRLWMIVWRMFGCFFPFPLPVDSEIVSQTQNAGASPNA